MPRLISLASIDHPRGVGSGLLKIWAGQGKLFIPFLFRGQVAEGLLTQTLERMAEMLSSPLHDVFGADRFQGLLQVVVGGMDDRGGQAQDHPRKSSLALL